MQRILFVGHEASRTGAPLALLETIRALLTQGIACEVLLLRGGPLASEYRKLCPTIVLKGPIRERLVRNVPIVFFERILAKFRMRLFVYTRRRKFDVVCLNAIASCSQSSLGERLRCPLIAYIHELPFGMATIHPLEVARLQKRASHFIVPAPCVARHLAGSWGIAPEKITVIPGAVPDPLPLVRHSSQDVRASLGIPAESFVIAMSGIVDWRKGIDLFIALGRMFQDQLPSAHFLWIGGGWQFDLFSQTWKELYGIDDDLAKYFHFVGERTDVPDLLNSCDLFALTSREDPLPLVHIEAAMLQKPIVCFSASGGAPEWIGDAGIVVPFQDTEAMASAIVDLSNNPGRRQKMGEVGRAMTLTKCLPDVVARQVREVIDSV